ncbi:MAG: ABC transporter permease [Nitrospirae bacterium]|nr:ABC transporter permease [Nitrospirota bacterium]
MLRVTPGGPFDREKVLPPEIKRNVEAQYHLDKPLWAQYGLYVKGLLEGDLGPSYKYVGRDVSRIIADTFPISATLGFLAFAFSLSVGIATGIVSGLRAGKWEDHLISGLASVGFSVPSFVLAAFLVYILSHWLHLLPPALIGSWKHFIMPTLVLAAGPTAYIARLTRANVIDTAVKDYIRSARARGVAEWRVLLQYVIRNAVTPVVSYSGLVLAFLITGSFIVEHIFAVPGMGRFFVTAVTNRDYPLIMGVTCVLAVVIILGNLVVDITLALLDPRLRERT